MASMKLPQLSLFGRSLLLISCEIIANAVCWIAAGISFGKSRETRSILSLALLAWTLGLRHALDADHISAIDNATRGLINLGQLPVTCGLFFSLGHSTIVVVVTIAIAISSDVYDRMTRVGEVGGIVGAAVSGAFLFIIGLANTIILWRIVKRRREDKIREQRRANGETVEEVERDFKDTKTIMMRILGPIITFVNRPWKMYPVGVLFGFGFDTASSIALLGISALAKRNADGSPIPSGQIVILPLLFTAGMTLVDSVDSVLMLYSYSGFPEKSFKIFTRKPDPKVVPPPALEDKSPSEEKSDEMKEGIKEEIRTEGDAEPELIKARDEELVAQETRVKMNVMSGLSIVLTLMSILVAFSISLITIMGLIGEQCGPCVAAAEADDGHGGGLAGRWWRGWANANEQSGYIGAAIVGGFLVTVIAWYGGRWIAGKVTARKQM